MCRLRFFEIYAHLVSGTIYDFNILSFLMGSLCISLTSPATLEHLKLNLNISFNEFNTHSALYANLHNADVWSHLDSITSHPTGSRLQRVDININICFDDLEKPADDKVSKAILDSLPLLCSKGILFVEVKL
jgi:hypothetical protein